MSSGGEFGIVGMVGVDLGGLRVWIWGLVGWGNLSLGNPWGFGFCEVGGVEYGGSMGLNLGAVGWRKLSSGCPWPVFGDFRLGGGILGGFRGLIWG